MSPRKRLCRATRRGPPESDAQLAQKKLLLEIADLNAGPHRTRVQILLTIATALLTVLTSVAIFMGGLRVSSQLQANTDRQIDAANYARLLQDFGTGNPAARTGAAHGLAAYTAVKSDRRDETIEILVDHLLSENDPDVLKAVSKVIADIGEGALEPLVAADRTAATQFARGAGEYVGLVSAHQLVAAGQERSPQWQTQLASLAVDNKSDAYLTFSVHLGQLLRGFTLAPGKSNGDLAHPREVFKELFEAQPLNDAYVSGFSTTVLMSRKNATALSASVLNNVDHYAVALVATGNALSEMLRLKGTKLPGKSDLSGIVLFQVDLRHACLDRTNVRNVFISGDARHATFRYADLSNSYLASMRANDANFTAATLYQTVVPATWDFPQPIYVAANWWSASKKVFNKQFFDAYRESDQGPIRAALLGKANGTPSPAATSVIIARVTPAATGAVRVPPRTPTPSPSLTAMPTPMPTPYPRHTNITSATPAASQTPAPRYPSSPAPQRSSSPQPLHTAAGSPTPRPSPTASLVVVVRRIPVWEVEARRRIALEEGVRLEMYFDPVGNRTIAYGLPLTAPSSRTILKRAGVADPDAVIAGKVPLTQDQADATLAQTLEATIDNARAQLDPGTFDKLSDARKFVVVDMAFSLGSGLNQLTHFRADLNEAVKQNDPAAADRYYGHAADRLATTQWYQLVGPRAKRDGAMIRSGRWVDASGDGSR